MNPKDKAMQLFNSFEADLMEADVYYLDYAKKRFALIVVDEIINNLVDLSEGIFTFIKDVEYWLEVKTEIEKL